jgi:thiol-disulfide isomerase/thioredoxin
MKKIILIQLLFITLLLSGQNNTELKGIVKSIGIDTLIIAKSHEDLRYNGVEIPIQEGKLFKYLLKHKYIEEHSIVYKSDLKKGVWRPINFFPNSKTIQFELYPTSQYNNNKIIGDNLSEQKLKYQKQFGERFSKIGNDIYGKISQLTKDSDEYNKVKLRLDSLNKEALVFQHNYFLNDESILGLNEYVFLLQNANRMMMSSEIFKDYQRFYLQQKSDHPLLERANNLYNALSEVKKGQEYINIVLADRKGNSSKLSELITKEKYTLLDLWAPWCGPCIKKSKLLRDNYSKIFKNCQIIGVVGGINEIEKAKKAISKFKYPWENYFEISDEYKIWEKYGIANSGGAQFLINNKGKILAVNPKLEELLEIVNEK